jgi:flagellar hook-associated protein 3 FlgL
MSGRITSNILTSNYLRNMKRNLTNMKTLQNQLASGKEIQKASDNPYTASRSMQLNTDMSYNKQYNENIKDTTNWLDTTDTALSQIGNIFGRVETLLVSAGNGAYGPDERTSIQDEIKEKVNELSQVLNTSFDGSYIFGGTKTDSKPTTVVNGVLEYADKAGTGIGSNSNLSVYKNAGGTITSDAIDPVTLANNTAYTLNSADVQSLQDELNNVATPPSGTRQTEINSILPKAIPLTQINSDLKVDISEGVKTTYNKTAVNVLEFKDKSGTSINVSDLFATIIKNLGTTGNTSDLTTTNLKDIQSVTANLLQQRSEVGSFQNRMDSAQTNNDNQNYNLTDILSKTEDIDFADKTMEYSMMQTVYTASLQTSAKILPMTILTYL